ncbi:MAG: hypothetical protein HKM90_11970 [Desulfobacteraceae bacterium]|nr:hypothetical protein [Desulfobacteraceae bacterium]
MTLRKDWPKLIAFVIFFMLIGGYYDRMDVEMRTFTLPLLIFAAAALIYGRLRQLQHEIRSSRVTAWEVVTRKLSLADTEGNERVSIATSPENTVMTFFDDNQVSRVTLELTNKEPVLRLMGDNGSAVVAIDYRGMPSFTLRDHADEVIWSAP